MSEVTFTLHHGDCRDVMCAMDANSIDAIVCDPPYGLAFMGKAWDHGVPGVEFWAEALRVAKPGAHLCAFGGTRTFHRLACAIEDAGWEIRDTLSWLYGSGFPKSHNGPWGGTALKPAWEPIILARKPLVGTVAQNVQLHGTGAVNVDACRIGASGESDYNHEREPNNVAAHNGFAGKAFARNATGMTPPHALGRWPANVVLSHTPDCIALGSKVVKGAAPQGQNGGTKTESVAMGGSWNGTSTKTQYVDAKGMETVEAFACAPDCPVALLDAQSGASISRIGKPRASAASGDGWGMRATGAEYDDAGGASRFFYCAKASRSEREAGLSGAGSAKASHYGAGLNSATKIRSDAQRDAGVDRGTARNTHPTVKPLALMQWLCRLVTPPNGLILDPFTGSGSTGVAAITGGFRFVGIEKESEYIAIARARIDAAEPKPPTLALDAA